MRKRPDRSVQRLLLTAAFFVISAPGAFAQQPTPWSQSNSPLPPPTGFVNDYAGVVDAATKQQLETKLKSLRDTTNPSVEIGIAVVKTTGDRPIFDYSLAVARGWKIGSKDDDNPSALLFIAIDDRKYFTQVSKDLEDELPDGVVGGLQRQYLVPEFKKGNYSKGISDTIDAYISTIRNKGNVSATPIPTGGTRPSDEPIGNAVCGFIICIGILILLLIVFLSSRRGGGGSKGSGWGGGAFGAGADIAANVASGVIGGIIGSALSGGSSSSSSNWGGSSSGGGDWGGFGGGGDFGGGGAGGSW